MSAGTSIVWKPEWDTGHQEIDVQHRTLLESLNRLQIAIENGSGEEELGWCLSFMKAYARVHFRTEEALMARYPDFDAVDHIIAHQALLEQIDVHFRRFMGGEKQLTQETLSLLRHWLMGHIREEDLSFSKTIHGQST